MRGVVDDRAGAIEHRAVVEYIPEGVVDDTGGAAVKGQANSAHCLGRNGRCTQLDRKLCQNMKISLTEKLCIHN